MPMCERNQSVYMYVFFWIGGYRCLSTSSGCVCLPRGWWWARGCVTMQLNCWWLVELPTCIFANTDHNNSLHVSLFFVRFRSGQRNVLDFCRKTLNFLSSSLVLYATELKINHDGSKENTPSSSHRRRTSRRNYHWRPRQRASVWYYSSIWASGCSWRDMVRFIRTIEMHSTTNRPMDAFLGFWLLAIMNINSESHLCKILSTNALISVFLYHRIWLKMSQLRRQK